MDRITVTFTQAGATMTASAQNRVIWTLPHVADVSIAEFGTAHLPVILTGSDQSFCGTGGCIQTTYTYDSATAGFVSIPFNPWKNPLYEWLPARKAWKVVPAINGPEGQLGGADLTSAGLSTMAKLYTLVGQSLTQNFRYAEDGQPSGEWLSSSPPQFGPDQLSFRTVYPAPTLNQAAAEYYAELMENHPRTAAKFVAPSANSTQLNARNQFVTSWGLRGGVGGLNARMVNSQEVQIPIWTTAGHGPQERLYRYMATVTGTQIRKAWYVNQTTVAPVSVGVPTVKDALEWLANNTTMRAWVVKHPDSQLSLDLGPNGMEWQAVFSTRSSAALTLDVNAESGSISLPQSDN